MSEEQRQLVTVLMVDDEAEFLAATAPALRRRGVEVCTAANGTDALARLAEGGIEVVVLDVKMPGMGGEEVYDHLRRAYPELPVIMLTGHGSVPQAFRMSKGGVFEYLDKPCSVELLADTIRAAAAVSPVLPGSPRRLRVLLVDDEPELIAALAPALGRRGITVLAAADGEQALLELARGEIDVVVLDVRLPGMDGLEVLERAKAMRPEVEVLLLSGHPDVEIAVEGMRRGAADYLTKPPDVDRLAERIREAARRTGKRASEGREEIIRRALERTPE